MRARIIGWLLSLIIPIVAIAQETPPPPLQVTPQTAVRGQLIRIEFAKENAVTRARVLLIQPGRDVDVTKDENGLNQLVALVEGQSYIFSIPTVGRFLVEGYTVQVPDGLIILQQEFEIIDQAPPAPPEPPGPTPNPGPNPPITAPFPSPEGLRVIIVSETEKRSGLPEQQAQIFSSEQLASWLSSNTYSDGKTSGYRIWDDDYTDDQLSQVAPVWKEAYKAAKKAMEELKADHVLVAASPRGGFVGKLPASVDDVIKELSKLR